MFTELKCVKFKKINILIILLHFKALSSQGGCPWCGLKEHVRVVQQKGTINKYNFCVLFFIFQLQWFLILFDWTKSQQKIKDIAYRDIFMAFAKIQI